MNQDFLNWLAQLTINPYLSLISTVSDPYALNQVARQQTTTGNTSLYNRPTTAGPILNPSVMSPVNTLSAPARPVQQPPSYPINGFPVNLNTYGLPNVQTALARPATGNLNEFASIPNRPQPPEPQFQRLDVGGIFPASLVDYMKRIIPPPFPTRNVNPSDFRSIGRV